MNLRAAQISSRSDIIRKADIICRRQISLHQKKPQNMRLFDAYTTAVRLSGMASEAAFLDPRGYTKVCEGSRTRLICGEIIKGRAFSSFLHACVLLQLSPQMVWRRYTTAVGWREARRNTRSLEGAILRYATERNADSLRRKNKKKRRDLSPFPPISHIFL